MVDSRKIEFPGATGATLAARLDVPANPRAFALFAHCFTCGKDIFAAQRIAQRLTASDIAVLRFDFTGIGSSEASSPTPTSRPMSAISSRRRVTCGSIMPRRRC